MSRETRFALPSGANCLQYNAKYISACCNTCSTNSNANKILRSGLGIGFSSAPSCHPQCKTELQQSATRLNVCTKAFASSSNLVSSDHSSWMHLRIDNHAFLDSPSPSTFWHCLGSRTKNTHRLHRIMLHPVNPSAARRVTIDYQNSTFKSLCLILHANLRLHSWLIT